MGVLSIKMHIRKRSRNIFHDPRKTNSSVINTCCHSNVCGEVNDKLQHQSGLFVDLRVRNSEHNLTSCVWTFD